MEAPRRLVLKQRRGAHATPPAGGQEQRWSSQLAAGRGPPRGPGGRRQGARPGRGPGPGRGGETSCGAGGGGGGGAGPAGVADPARDGYPSDGAAAGGGGGALAATVRRPPPLTVA